MHLEHVAPMSYQHTACSTDDWITTLLYILILFLILMLTYIIRSPAVVSLGMVGKTDHLFQKRSFCKWQKILEEAI